jgi:hypothetical protein
MAKKMEAGQKLLPDGYCCAKKTSQVLGSNVDIIWYRHINVYPTVKELRQAYAKVPRG